MNDKLIDKLINDINVQVDKIDENQVIRLLVPTDDKFCNYKFLKNITDKLAGIYKTNVIVMPKELVLDIMDKEELISKLETIIDNLRDNINNED